MQAPSSPPRVSTSSNDTPNCQKNAPRARKYAYPPPVPPHPPPSLGNHSRFPHLHSPFPPLPRPHPTATGNCQKTRPRPSKSHSRHLCLLIPLPRSEITPRSPICTCHSLPCLDVTRRPLEIAKKTAPGMQNRVPGPLPGLTPSHFESQARGIAPVPSSSHLSPSSSPRHRNTPKKTATGAQNRVPGTLSVQLTSHFNIQARGIAPVPSSSHLSPLSSPHHRNTPKKRPRVRRMAYPAPSRFNSPPTSIYRHGASPPCRLPFI